MSTLFPHAIPVLHRTGSRVNGRWVGTSTEASITGSVQPLNGRDLQFLPEGRRDTGLVKIYCNTELAVSTEGSDTSGDVVVWSGKEWEVIQALEYSNGLIDHFKYIAAYIGPHVIKKEEGK